MAYLGVPYRIVYVAQNYRSGLTDVYTWVKKPDGTRFGPFDLIEDQTTGFTGTYAVNFYTDPLEDPEGEYTASVTSPTELVRDLAKFTLEQRGGGGDLVGDIYTHENEDVIGWIETNQELVAYITAPVTIEGVLIYPETLANTLEMDSEIKGVIYE